MMEKQSPAFDADCTTSFYTVFIDTSLDTHLATIVSSNDTVSDLKKKILLEHPLCFPKIGEIQIHALKVKRRGYFYHLSESMLVKSAFDWVNKSWFISVDASRIEKDNHTQHSLNPDSIATVAHFGIINNGSVNGFKLLTDGNTKDLSNDDDLGLLQGESDQHVNQNVPVADHIGLDNARGGFSNNLMIQVEQTDDEHGKVASQDTNSGSGSHVHDKHEQDSKQTKVQITPIGDGNGNSWHEMRDKQGSIPTEEAVETGSHMKRKHQRKKKIKSAEHDLVLKESDGPVHESGENESQQENMVLESSLGIAGGVVTHDLQMANQDVANGPSMSSFTGATNHSGTVVQGTNVLNVGTEVPREHVERQNEKSNNDVVDMQCDKSLENTSQYKPAKKKRKYEKGNGDADSLKENAIPDSNKEASETPMISQPCLVDKQKVVDASLNGLSNETLEDVHLQSDCPTSGKKKRKKKSSNLFNQEIVAVPSHGKDVGGESSRVTMGINTKDLGDALDAPSVPLQYVQDAMISDRCVVSLQDKHSDPIQKINKRPSSQDAGNVERRHDAPEPGTTFTAKRSRSSKDHCAINMEGHPHPVIQGSDNTVKDVGISRHENIVLNDSWKHVADQTDRVEEGRELSQNISLKTKPSEKCRPSVQDKIDTKTKDAVVPSQLPEASETVDPRKSSKKRRNSKRTRDIIVGTTVTTDAKKGSASTIFSTEQDNTVNEDHPSDKGNKEENSIPQKRGRKKVSEMDMLSTSLLAADREIDAVIQNAVESVRQIGEAQVNSENMDGKSRKKTKKKRSSDAKNLPELQAENEDVVHNGLALSTVKTKEVHSSSKLVQQTDLGNKTSINQSNESNLGPRKDDGPENDSLNTHLNSVTVESSQVPLHKTEGSSEGMSLLATYREIDDVIQNVVESMQQIGKAQVNAENLDGKSRKKTKKKQSSNARNFPELQTETKNAVHKGPAPSTNETREVETLSKMAKQTDLGNKSSINRLNDSNLEPEKNTAIENDSVSTHLNTVTIGSSQVPPHKPEGNSEGRCLGAVVNVNCLLSSQVGEISNNMEVSSENNRIKFTDYLVPSQNHHEAVAAREVLVDKAPKAKGADNEMKAKKNKKKKLNAHFFGGVKTPQSSKSDELNFVPEAARRSNNLKPSGTNSHTKSNKEACAASNSSLESSKTTIFQNDRAHGHQSQDNHHHVNHRKASATNTGEVVNSSEQQKSLIGRSGAIFNDDSYEGSTDEDGLDNSDAITRTPSNNSLSSDYSDGESDADFNSQHGSYGLKGKDGGGKSIKKPFSSGMSLDTILRSSSMYKKAKKTASQSQLEDTESQPVDFVPDSQANP